MELLDLPVRLTDLVQFQKTAELREHRSRAYVRWVACLSRVGGNPDAASQLFLENFGDSWGNGEVRKSLATLECKAAVAPGSTTGADWAAPLVGVQALATGFAQIVHSASLFSRISGLQLVPFQTSIPRQSAAANFSWVGEGHPKPFTKVPTTTGPTLTPVKAAGEIAVTDELVRLALSGAELALRNQLQEGIVAFQDRWFLNPANAGVAGVSPASITNGLAPTANTGVLATDVQSLLNSFFAARPGARDVALIANAQKAGQLRGMNPGFGFPIISTEAAGANVIVVDGSGIYYADGGVRVDIGREHTVQMSDAPDDPPTAATVMLSLWQLGMVGYLVERTLNWYAVPTSVAYLA